MPHESHMPPYCASDDRARIDMDMVHGWLSQSYWCKDIPRALLEKAVANSLPFGVYDAASGARAGMGAQVGFCRLVTDRATYAYLADVFIIESHRGRGLSKLMMKCVMSHPELQGLRRWGLMTRDAHGLYSQFGFQQLAEPQRAMEIHRRNLYETSAAHTKSEKR